MEDEDDATNSRNSNVFNDVARFIEEHSRKFQFSFYVLGAIGLGVTARSLRIATKFKSLGDVPQDFVRKGVQIRGEVKHVRPDGVFLVDHLPILSLRPPWTQKKNRWEDPDHHLLSLKLYGVEITPAGFQNAKRMENQRFWFKLVERKDDALACILNMDTGNKFFNRRVVLNNQLVEKGLATVDPHVLPNPSNPSLQKFNRGLLHSQSRARKTNKGLWHQEPNAFRRLLRKLSPF